MIDPIGIEISVVKTEKKSRQTNTRKQASTCDRICMQGGRQLLTTIPPPPPPLPSP